MTTTTPLVILQDWSKICREDAIQMISLGAAWSWNPDLLFTCIVMRLCQGRGNLFIDLYQFCPIRLCLSIDRKNVIIFCSSRPFFLFFMIQHYAIQHTRDVDRIVSSKTTSMSDLCQKEEGKEDAID